MRLLGILGVLCVVATPVLASPVLYTFNSTSGTVSLNIRGQSASTTTLAGTFAIDIYQSNGHIGNGDTFVLGAANLTNTGTLALTKMLGGLLTGTLPPGAARFLSFGQPAAATLSGGSAVASTDVYLQATIFASGFTNTSFGADTWAGTLLPFNVSLTTSTAQSDVVHAGISGAFGYEVGITDVHLTITLDLAVTIEGTAHAVPDPALGGLTALGLAGAGAWLRNRRS
jgi:hypothetical protein